MAVRKLDNGRYEVTFYFDHPLTGERERFRRWSPHTSKRKAEQWGAEHRTKLTDRNYWLKKREREAREGIPTLSEFKDTFISAIEPDPNYSTGTVTNYESKLRNHVVPILGEKRLDCIETTDMNTLIRRKRSELGANTVRGICTALGSLLTFAESEGVIPRGVRPDIDGPPLPSPQQQRPPSLSDEQLDELIECAHDRVKSMIRVAARTGLRVGELQGLMWDDIDKERLMLRVRRQFTSTCSTSPAKMPPPKGGPRDIPLTEKTLVIFDQHRQTRWSGDPFVFSFKEFPSVNPSSPTEDQGSSLEPIHIQRLRSPIDVAFERAALTHTSRRWHCLRHTYAARLATRGTPLQYIQRLLGHKSIETTQIYAHLLPEAHDIARRCMVEMGL